jgi:hypothetical protein
MAQPILGIKGTAEYVEASGDGTPALPYTPTVRQASQIIDGAGFSNSGSSVIDPFFVQTPVVGAGVTYNQASGSINILSGTTANAEFLARSRTFYCGSMRMRFSVVVSQRIANSNFAVLLADLIGENLTYNIQSATSVNVIIPNHGFTSLNVGQFIHIGGIVGASGAPGRYAIASIVDINTINFTVSGWSATGTGTCTLFGRNYIRNLLTGTIATAVNVDSQRNGWAAGDTVATINTTATPGTVLQAEITGREVFWFDALRATATTPTFTSRASRYENIPDPTINLYVFLWNFNGTIAPASTTTFTLGHLTIESFANNPVYLQGVRSTGSINAIPANIVAGTLSTVTTVSGVTTVTSANLGVSTLVSDIGSAAITSTASSSVITPTFGCSYEVNIPVTLITGTTPTLDIDIQETDDTSTNWFTVYSFPRITATGIYRSPKLPLLGNRLRYVQTLTGTSPSFTRAINRLQFSDSVPSVRQLIDRSVVLTTLNSITPSLNVQNCNRLQLAVNIGASTTNPSLQLQGSEDNGVSWYSIGSAITAVANSTVSITIVDVNTQLLRAIVTTAGSGVTMGYILLKGF